MSDPHAYPPPHDDILRNSKGIFDSAELQEYETTKSLMRIRELDAKPIVGNFNSRHLCDTHKHIFQDVYPWAGKIRTVSIRKPERILGGGSVDYPYPDQIKPSLDSALGILKKIDFSAPLNKICKNLAQATSDLWLTHPFREGNTRTITMFVMAYAKQRGISLDKTKLIQQNGQDTFRDALVASTVDMPEYLAKRFEKSMSNVKQQPKRRTLNRPQSSNEITR